MSKSVAIIVIGVILLGIVPIVPKMLALRVRVLHFFRWNRLADWHERNARGIIIGVRLLFAALAVYLLMLAIF